MTKKQKKSAAAPIKGAAVKSAARNGTTTDYLDPDDEGL